jgi:hypothetical protein
VDQAGNEVDTAIERWWLVDDILPTNQNIQIPGSLVGGAPAVFSVPTADDLDLWTGAFSFTFSAFPAGPYFPFGDEVVSATATGGTAMSSPPPPPRRPSPSSRASSWPMAPPLRVSRLVPARPSRLLP